MSSRFESPIFSRNQVNRAGIWLSNDAKDSDSLHEGIEILTNWRTSHLYILNLFRNRFNKILKNKGIEAIVSQRLKRTPSIVDKLKRNQNMMLSRMQDIAGMRIVVSSLSEMQELGDSIIHSKKTAKEIDNVKAYLKTPKLDGYRGLHIILKYQPQRRELAQKYAGMRLELQVRTELQHAWATSVEIIDSFLGKSLKTSLSKETDEPLLFKLFKNLSGLMALDERLPMPEGLTFEVGELIRETLQMVDESNLISNLSAFVIAIDNIHPSGSEPYYIIHLDREKRIVSFKQFKPKEFKFANTLYSQLEFQYKNDTRHDILLVGAKSISELRSAYPNYFGGAENVLAFIEDLQNGTFISRYVNAVKIEHTEGESSRQHPTKYT